ncbi:hypothetical protein [Yoonia sp.]|uniref:hypothetical protein n=1 Tax=Yoonia sp. TaxID=2212373 RepID=UPI0023B4A78B
MDPAIFLSKQAFQNKPDRKPDPDEIEAFYAEHGLEVFTTIFRWRAGLVALWQRSRRQQSTVTHVASMAHRS